MNNDERNDGTDPMLGSNAASPYKFRMQPFHNLLEVEHFSEIG